LYGKLTVNTNYRKR